MIDPVDLALVEDAADRLVEHEGGVEVAAERLLDDDAAPPAVSPPSRAPPLRAALTISSKNDGGVER